MAYIVHSEKPSKNKSGLCFCGCGKTTNKFRGQFHRFIKGHENIGRIPWNKNKAFSEATKKKMSLAHIGKEPANKAHIDIKKLRQFYVIEKKSITQVSKILNISKDSIKNRLQFLGWSRSTKETCSLQWFKEEMREIRIKTLSSQKAIETPNKLEKIIYDAIDKSGIKYQKQAPLFNKFVVDAFFPQCNLVLEIFGRYWHEKPEIKTKDYSKKRYLEKCGYQVEELWDYQIKNNNPDLLLKNIFRKYNLSS